MPSKLHQLLGHAPLRLIAIVLFAILVPSLLVTALGLAAVFQAQAFVQDRFIEDLRSKAEAFRQRLDVEWSRRTSIYAERFRDAGQSRPFLGDLRGRDPWVRDIVVSTSRGLELVGEPPPTPLWAPVGGDILRELERLEYAEHDSNGALAECRKLRASVDDDRLLVDLLLTEARLAYRLGRREESIYTLREVLNRYGNTSDATGVVRALPVSLRIAEVEKEIGDPAREREALRELARALERYKQFLEPELLAYFRDRLVGFGELGEAEFGSRAERLIEEKHLPELARRLPLAGALPPGWTSVETHATVADLGTVDFLTFLSSDSSLRVHLLLDEARLREEAEQAASWVGLAAPGVRFVRRGAADNSAEEPVAVPLPQPIQHVEMRYAPPESGLPEAFRGFRYLRLATFAWAVIVLVLAIVAGVLFSLWHVLREMRTARQKSDFVSFITHELKTPLTAIRTLTDTMLGGKTDSEEENHYCLQLIGSETDRLAKLVEQVLEYSKIERKEKRFQFASCSMEEVVQEAVRIFQDHNRLQPRDIEINTAQSISKIKMDRAAMIELLLNLLSNAAKYSGKDKRIVINLRESINDICVDVVDRGVGIRKRDQKKIFERFFRAEDYLTRDVEGTGLGLTFARYIAKVHNGEIRVSSQVAAGSTFTLQLRKTHVLAE
ncbi:MAG TPA: HAMP domain-containing sensor histidine kinase [Planctomycetota bacterium]|nr:HAMP domain-containing sensor histidine kinase [Planctomycetota bacterium]